VKKYHNDTEKEVAKNFLDLGSKGGETKEKLSKIREIVLSSKKTARKGPWDSLFPELPRFQKALAFERPVGLQGRILSGQTFVGTCQIGKGRNPVEGQDDLRPAWQRI